MITFKTVKGKHVVTHKGVKREPKSLSEALRVALALYLNK